MIFGFLLPQRRNAVICIRSFSTLLLSHHQGLLVLSHGRSSSERQNTQERERVVWILQRGEWSGGGGVKRSGGERDD